MIGTVNRFLFEKLRGEKYATLVIARLSPTGEVEVINCGHVPPIIVSGESATKLEDGNLPVGLIPMAKFTSSRYQLKAGDRLVVVTDGVTEAEDAEGEFFGINRLEACCVEGFDAIERAVTKFRGSNPMTACCTITEMIYRG
jgi:serine phosphatase RsbU (regulator of sigma subunit)